ncbi:hypothetical protein LUZ62_079864 [Rhynchospora pubera]|uniref:Uncharacterized protein n=1 Tax=Rhynchospora pubera TaxID=906938 RepID=A0AAV8BR86_9POAL|nr:hypothetical protein LUZ62_079864 [Rhynchospora pubera]
MASGSNEYEVMIRSVETVIPAVLVQEHRLPRSNFDILLPAVDISLYFCFQKPTPTACQDSSVRLTTFPTMVAALKAALSKALVIYYTLAGEFVTNAVGEPEILCNSRGVDLIEAYADVELRELNLYNPEDSVEDKLLPKKINGILCIQVTELRCGAMVVGCKFDHRAADSYSFFMFMSAWADIVRNKPINQLPSYCRFLLSSRIFLSSSNSTDPIISRIYAPLSFEPSGNPKRRWLPEIDFGWGNAAFWSIHYPKAEKGGTGYLMPIPQSTGDWVVYAQVEPSIVAAMEQEKTIFRPLRTLAVAQ